MQKFALIGVNADLRKGVGCVSGKGKISQCSEGPRWPVRRAGCGKPSLAPEHKHDTWNDLLSNLPSLLFFLPLIVNIPSLLKLASQLKLNTDSEPSNHFGVFFFLHPTNNWDGMHLNKPKVISLF